VKKNPRITGNEIKEILGITDIPERTIRRRIRPDSEFASYWKTKKPYISKKNSCKRLQFARDHLKWTEQDWHMVLWSGESPIVLIVNQKTSVWRLRNDRYKVHSTIATIKHDKKINIWGYFCPSGVRELYSVDGILLREEYKKN
jgi:hypothetical protein